MVALDGFGDDGRVFALIMGGGGAQIEGTHLVFDNPLAAPSRRAAGQVRLTVAVGVEQLGDLGIGELAEIGDTVFLGGFLVDQIALSAIGNIGTRARQLFGPTGLVVECLMQWIPVVGDEGDVAGRDRQMQGRVFGVQDLLYLVAQRFQSPDHDDRLEVLAVHMGLTRLHDDTLAGQVVVGQGRRAAADGEGRHGGRHRGPGEQCTQSHIVPFLKRIAG